jgi:hypothetical protein
VHVLVNAPGDVRTVDSMDAVAKNGYANGYVKLPKWAQRLVGEYPRYSFSPCDVFRGKAVAAVRSAPGSGPYVVITDDESDMRAALGNHR